MIKLFKYEGYKLNISEEALLLKPFKEIWQRDKSKNKDKALQELGYVYFISDPRSDYQYLDSNNDEPLVEWIAKCYYSILFKQKTFKDYD